MDDVKGWYNGYSPGERDLKFKELKRQLKKAAVPPATGPCGLCGDPDVLVEYHSEDYASPFRWTPPAMYALCRNCHRDKLHKRFSRPLSWQAFVAHIRRGGYAKDLKNDPLLKKELMAYETALGQGGSVTLKQLRPYRHTAGTEWFANLRMDAASLTDPAARPR